MTTSTQSRIAPGTYRIDPARSSMAFAVRKIGLITVRGTFAVRDGMIVVADDPLRSTATATIAAGSFHTGNARRDKDVTSARFLDTAKHPTITFTSSSLGRRDDGPWQMSGTLTVRGTDCPVVVTVTEEPDGRLRGTARVDRYACGVTAGKGIVGRYLDITMEIAVCP